MYVHTHNYIQLFFFFFFKIKMGWVVGVRGGRVLDIPILHITTDCHAPPSPSPFPSLSLLSPQICMYIQYSIVQVQYILSTQRTHAPQRTHTSTGSSYICDVPYFALHTKHGRSLFFITIIEKLPFIFLSFFLSFCLSLSLSFPFGGWGR